MKGMREGASGPEQGKSPYVLQGFLPHSLLPPGTRMSLISLCTLPCPLGCTQEGQEQGGGIPLEPLSWSTPCKYCPSTVLFPALLPGGSRPAFKARGVPASSPLPFCFSLLLKVW